MSMLTAKLNGTFTGTFQWSLEEITSRLVVQSLFFFSIHTLHMAIMENLRFPFCPIFLLLLISSITASVVICVSVQSLISFHFLRVWGETIVPKELNLFVFTASASTSFHAGFLYVCHGCVRLCAYGRSQSDVCVDFITPNHPRVCEVLSGRPCCVRVIVCVRPLLHLITVWGRSLSRQIEGL